MFRDEMGQKKKRQVPDKNPIIQMSFFIQTSGHILRIDIFFISQTLLFRIL